MADKRDQLVAEFACSGEIAKARQLPLEDYCRYLINKTAEIAAEPQRQKNALEEAKTRQKQEEMNKDAMYG